MNAGVLVASALFSIGMYGVLTRRELVAVLAAIEVMLGGATLLLVVLTSGASGAGVSELGQAYALVLLTVVAAESAVGLALLVALVRRGKSAAEDIREVRG